MSHVSWKEISEIGQLFIVLDGSKVHIRDLLLDKIIVFIHMIHGS